MNDRADEVSIATLGNRRKADPGGVVAEVARIGEVLFDQLDRLRLNVSDALASAPARTKRGDLKIQDVVADLLGRGGSHLIGAGFVAAPRIFADAPYWLEWWTTDPGAREPSVQRLDVQVDPTADDFHDYTNLAWFTVPRDTGSRHVTGPYVDYLCTDTYTLTFTIPVLLAGQFAGVVGADVAVGSIERELAAALAGLGTASALVNAQGRVLTSWGTGWITGDLVRTVPLSALWADTRRRHEGWRLLRCADLPFGLLTRQA